MPENAEYEVGYKKPPAHSRWKPGQSGNPRGRPKRTKEVGKLLERELDQLVRITERGQQTTLTKREILLKTLVNIALKGDLRALKMLLPYLKSGDNVDGFEPDPDDRAALNQLLSDYRGPHDAEDHDV